MKSTNKILKNVLKYLGNYKFLFVFSIILAAASVALTLYLPILIGKAIDLIVGKGDVKFSEVAKILIISAVIVGATSVIQWIMNTVNNKIVFNVVRDIRSDAFKRIERLPLSYIDSHPYGEIVSRVIADADQLSDGLLMGFTQFFTGVATILGTLVFMFRIDFIIALVVVLLTPLSLLTARFIASRTYSMFKLQSEIRAEQTAVIDETIQNGAVVKAFNREKRL